MCGRFALDYSSTLLTEWYGAKSIPDLFPRYNIAPLSDILTILETENGREGRVMRWGFVPSWAKDSKKLPVLNNARAETIALKPMFKLAFKKHRCIIPATGFYEWKLLNDKTHKQPYFISTNDGCPVSFAGIWDTATINGVTLDTCAIITTGCNELVRSIHDRMPVILPLETFDTWLAPTELPDEILNFFLKPYDSEKMQLWPVSTAVNKAINQGRELIQPINDSLQN